MECLPVFVIHKQTHLTWRTPMKLNCFARPPKFKNRMIMMILGVLCQGFGLSVLININLGVDPCSSLTQGIINYVPITFGTAQLLCQLVSFMFVLRFDISLIGFGTIGNMVFIGYISDFCRFIWSLILPDDFFLIPVVRFGLLVPALAIFVLGAATYMTAGLGTSPYDGLPFIISSHVKRFPFKIVRMMWDISFMAAGFILGGDVGLVTIAVAFFLGPVITWIQGKLARFIQ